MIRGSTKIFLETLASVALVLILLAGFAAWRLGSGPISIAPITPYIESALSDPASGRRVSIGASGLIWDAGEHAIEVRADRVSVFDAKDQAVMVVPEMTLRFHLAALMRGIFVPRTVTLVRPAVTVIRTAEGGWEFSAVPDSDQGPSAAGSPAPLAPDLIEGALAELDRFRLVDARLVIDDRRAHALWVAPQVSVALIRARDGFEVESTVALDVDGRRVGLHGAAHLDRGFNPIEGDLTVADLVPAKIARRIEELSDFAALDLPLGATLHVTRQAEGGPDVRFRITGAAGQLVRPELPGGAVAVTALTAEGHFQVGKLDLELDALTLALATTTLTVSGTARDLGGQAAVDGRLAVASLPLDDLRKYWPPDVAPNPRRWMLANMTQGVVRDTALRFALHRAGGGIALDMLDGSMAVDGARVRYLKTQPPVEQVAGVARFDAQHFDIAVSAGRLRGLKIDNAKMTISGLADRDQQMTLEVAQSGPVSDVLVLLDMPPFGYVHRYGRTPQSVGGDMTAHLSLKFPLEDRLTLDDVGLSATASLSGLAVSKAVRDLDLTAGRFDLNLDKAGMGLIGQGQLGGVPAALSWTENFERTAPFQRRYDVAATVTEVQRRILGLELDGYVSGPVAATMSYTDFKDGRSSLVGTLDLGATALKLDDLSWTKPAGAPATGRFDIRLADGKMTTLERAELSGGGLTVHASGGFAQGRLAKLDIPQIKVGATDIGAQVAWQGERIDVVLSGRNLDASAMFGGDDLDAKPPRAMTLSAKLDRVEVGAGRSLEKVDVRADSDGTRWRSAAISSVIDATGTSAKAAGPSAAGAAGKSAMRLALVPRAGGRDLTVTADDAGAVLKTFGLTGDVEGGKLRVEGRYDDAVAIDRLHAKVTIDDYRLVRAPLLAKLLAVTSITGIPDLFAGDGIGFQELSLQVVKSPNRLEITDGRTSGRAMGLTVQGTIEGPDDVADLTGTLVPINSVNRLFESIPLIGDIVTGGGGGLFAFTYAVHGPMDNPSVTVNPLSVLAPGFIRNLFRWQLPGGGASSAPPPSTSSGQ